MSEDSLKLVLQKKHKKSSTSMTKISIKSGKLTSFGGIFSIMEQFDSMLSSVINSTLQQSDGKRTIEITRNNIFLSHQSVFHLILQQHFNPPKHLLQAIKPPQPIPLPKHLLKWGYLTIRLRYPKYTTEGI